MWSEENQHRRKSPNTEILKRKINMSIQNQLFDAVYYGTDLEFQYNGNYYFINSGKMVQGTTGCIQSLSFARKNLFMKETIIPNAKKYIPRVKKMQMRTHARCLRRKFLTGSLFSKSSMISATLAIKITGPRAKNSRAILLFSLFLMRQKRIDHIANNNSRNLLF